MFKISSVLWGTKLVTMYFVAALCSILIASYVGSERLPEERILNGTETNTIQIPYQVSIEAHKAYRCSGSIIAPNWILTVAHCVKGLNIKDLRVRVNAVMRGVLGDLYDVSDYTLHPEYNHETFDYDMALVKINGTTDSDNIVAIATKVPYKGQTAKVSGWGAPSSGQWLSAQLHEKEVTIVYFNDCKYLYESIENPVTERMICASSKSGGPCQGDTGDPLVYNNELIGMMSWSFGCGEGKFPAVYADVTKILDWVNKTTFLKEDW